jgi:hypothetical protein
MLVVGYAVDMHIAIFERANADGRAGIDAAG